MKFIIAKNTQITDDFKRSSLYSEGDVTEYNNGEIKYKNKIYESFSIDEYSDQLKKKIFNVAKPAVNRMNDYSLLKLLLTDNNAKVLINIIQQIANNIIDNNKVDNFDAIKSGNYIFVEKDSTSFNEEDYEKENASDTLEEYRNDFQNFCNNIFKEIKNNSKTQTAQQLSIYIDKKYDELHQKYDQYTNLMNEQKNKIKNAQTKKLIEEKINKWKKNKDQIINKIIEELKKIKPSDSKIIQIDGKERKANIIEKKGQLTIINFFGSNKLSIIKGDHLLLDGINEKDIKYYGQIKALRVIVDEEKTLITYDGNTILKNSYVVGDLQNVEPSFNDTYFLLFNNGTIEIRKISDGLTGSAIVSAKTINKLKAQAKTNSQLQEYFEDDSSTTSTSPSSSSTTSSSTFDKRKFNRFNDQRKIEYLKSLGNVELKISDLDTSTVTKLVELKYQEGNNLSNIKLASYKNIKISRKNRHLSLQHQMLNKIFKKL